MWSSVFDKSLMDGLPKRATYSTLMSQCLVNVFEMLCVQWFSWSGKSNSIVQTEWIHHICWMIVHYGHCLVWNGNGDDSIRDRFFLNWIGICIDKGVNIFKRILNILCSLDPGTAHLVEYWSNIIVLTKEKKLGNGKQNLYILWDQLDWTIKKNHTVLI